MKFASKFTFFNQRKKAAQSDAVGGEQTKETILRKKANIQIDEEELFRTDVNVMSIGFAFLKEAQKNMGTGDAVFCTFCKAALNSFSKILSKDEYLNLFQIKKEVLQIEEEYKGDPKKLEPSRKIDQDFFELKPNEKVWICEFCEKQNKFIIENEEIPKKNDMIYITESKTQAVGKKIDEENDISIILCVDNSGSMSITTEVKGQINLKHGLTQEEYNMLKEFIDPGAEKFQYLPKQKKNSSWVSRKQCVLAAIENQLNEMKNTHPNRKVGLITFNNDVAIIGDGKGEPKFIAGDKLYKFKEIVEVSQNSYEEVMKEPLKNSSANLIHQFSRLEEGGKTALGPALLAAISLASKGKKGSMVIICTDGLANVGLGSLDLENEQIESNKFYADASKIAQDNNIIISLITIKGEGCKVQILGQLAEDTNGNVTRVNPADISKDFSEILKDEIVATNVDLEIRLHKGLRFSNEDEENLNPDGSLLKKKIGNATINTEVAFQYEIKGEDELNQMNIDIEKALEVPFQAQIHYSTLEGNRFIRVITHVQKLTKNKDLAEKNADIKILHFAAAQKSSNWARVGNYEMSRKFNKNWSEYLDNNQNLNSNESNLMVNQELQIKQKCLRGAIVKKEKKAEKEQGLGLFDSGSESDQEIKKHKKKAEVKEKKEKANLEKKTSPKPLSKKLLLSKVDEKEEKEEKQKKKKKSKRKLSCSSGSEKMELSEDEGEAVMYKCKKGI